jgi:hypothetical protein
VDALKSVKLVTILLRIATAAVIVAPFVVYYASSRSLTHFLIPKIETRMPVFKYKVLSYNVSRSDGGYVLELKILNLGDTAFGIKDFEARVLSLNQEFEGRFSLESPVVLAPGQESSVRVVLFPVRGDLNALSSALSRDEVFNVTGRATLVLGGAELPLSFNVRLRPSEVGMRGGF